MQIRRVFTFGMVILGVLGAAGGCQTHYRAHPELEARMHRIKTIGIIPADVRMYELSAGDVEELRDDWSSQAQDNVTKALAAGLKERNVYAKNITVHKEFEQEIEDIQALYRTVGSSILYYTYGETPLPGKYKNFTYSVGPMEKFLDAHGVDAVVLVDGFDEISTGGRKALRTLSLVTGLITGVTKRAGMTGLSIAVVDRTGSVLWFNANAYEGGYDLRDAGSAKSLVKSVLAGLPEVTK